MAISSINIFKKAQLGGIQPSCHIFRSATFESLANEDGTASNSLINCYTKLAEGGCGLIISGGIYVDPLGRGHRHQLGIINSNQIDSLSNLIRQVHLAHGLIAFQLNHAGLEARSALTDSVALGPSQSHKKTREMTEQEVDHVIKSFVNAAHTSYAIGADAVQLHAAHGYLLGEFLSPIWNKRNDVYGKDRFEIINRIVKGIRSKVPDSFTILVKMNGSDIEKSGITLKNAIETAKKMENVGVSGLEISSGSGRKPYSLLGDFNFDKIFKDPKKREIMKKRFSDIHFKPHFNEDFAAEIKKNVKIPVISVGGYTNKLEIENAIKSGKCDFVSLSRPFIREPALVNQMKEGKCTEVSCNRCTSCFFDIMADKPLKCTNF